MYILTHQRRIFNSNFQKSDKNSAEKIRRGFFNISAEKIRRGFFNIPAVSTKLLSNCFLPLLKTRHVESIHSAEATQDTRRRLTKAERYS